jgi:putative membrane protein
VDLQEIVKQNRFTISVIFPFVGAITLLDSAQDILPEILSYNPYFIIFGTLVMRLPLVAGVEPLLDRKALLGLGVLTAYSYVIEIIGVTTGFPYGEFEYLIELGPMLFGKVPLGLPVFFIPLVINAYLLILLLMPERSKKLVSRLLAVIGTVLFLDLILDPAAVAINFWSYSSGLYYGVPLSNYLGWILSASVSVIVLDFSFDRQGLVQRLEECEFMLDDMVSFVFLWGFVNLYFMNWVPFVLSVVLGLALYSTDRFDFVSRDDLSF